MDEGVLQYVRPVAPLVDLRLVLQGVHARVRRPNHEERGRHIHVGMEALVRFLYVTSPAVCFSLTMLALMLAFNNVLSPIFFVAAFVGILDARGRWLEYQSVLKFLSAIDGVYVCAWKRELRRHRYSWCQRRAACCAFDDRGIGSWAREHLHSIGYRWWHVLPDGTFTRRSPYLRRSFWASLLGMK